MLKKLFGGNNEFYVQLDETQTATPEIPAPEPTPAPVAVASEAAAKPQKSVKKSAKAPTEIKAPEPTPVIAPKPKVDPAQVAFASADPIPQNMARRSPGPSLNKFKEMARQVKTR